MLTLKQEWKLMALDHFSRASVIDEAARVLRNQFTHQMTGQSPEMVKQQLAIGELLASTKLEPTRDRLIEAGIQLWKLAHETTGTSAVPSRSSPGQTQETPRESTEEREGTPHATGV